MRLIGWLATFASFVTALVPPAAVAAAEGDAIYRNEKNFEDLTPAEHTAAKAAARERKLKSLLVCADPGNMPLSNDKREGFQNKIAETLAEAMGTRAAFFWRPYLERGLTRETFDNRECDVLLDMPFGYEGILTTQPIYRSTYVLAYRSDRGIDIKGLDDPQLKTLKIGVFQHSGLREVFTRKGIRDNLDLHIISHNADLVPENQPWRQVQKVVDGALDAAGVWGPFAGYVQKVKGAPLTVMPVNMMDDKTPLEFDLAIGMRSDDVVLKYMLDNALDASKDKITAILNDYGVPLVQCSKCIVAGTLPSHGSYYQRFKPETAQKRFLEPSQSEVTQLGADATPDQKVDVARLKSWLADGADVQMELGNAVLGSDHARVKFLISKGADLNALDRQGYNALHSAARHRDSGLVALLLDLGADINLHDRDGWTPMMHAAFRNHVPTLKLLHARGADMERLSKDGGQTALAVAIGEGQFWAAQALLETGASVHSRVAAEELTPLMLAATQLDARQRAKSVSQGPGIVDIARELLSRGADVNAVSKSGVTALMIAAGHNNAPMLGFLLQSGAKPEIKSLAGKTALDVALEARNDAAIGSLKLLAGQASN